MVQQLWTHLVRQGTPAPSLTQEDPACGRATKPVTPTTEPGPYSLWATTTSPRAATAEAQAPRACAPKRERSHGNDKAKHGNKG